MNSTTGIVALSVLLLALATGGGYFLLGASGGEDQFGSLDGKADPGSTDTAPNPFELPKLGVREDLTDEGKPSVAGSDASEDSTPDTDAAKEQTAKPTQPTPEQAKRIERQRAEQALAEEQRKQAVAEQQKALEQQAQEQAQAERRKALEESVEKAHHHQVRGWASRAYRRRSGAPRRQTRGNGNTPTTQLDAAPEDMNPEPEKQLQPGLYGEYYALYDEEPLRTLALGDDPTAGKPTFTRVDTQINFPNRASFGFQTPTTNFVVRWRGFIYVEEDTTLELWLGNDIGGAVKIDGQTVVLNDVFHWYVDTGTKVKLSAGYHQLEVEHIESYQPDDPNMNSACRLMYVPEDETKAVPVPAEWLFQPLELSDYAPRISRITPQIADVGDEITIQGANLVPRMISVGEVADVSGEAGAWSVSVALNQDWQGRVGDFIELRTPLDENLGSVRITSLADLSFTATGEMSERPSIGSKAVIPFSSGQFFEGKTRVTVTIAGVDAEVISSSQNQIRCIVPVCADSGEIEVSVGGMPSNRIDFYVSTKFGLVVSVWDLTGQAYDFVDPNTRAPDYVVLDETPFPLTPDKFPQFSGKPIAVRVEGFVASAAAGSVEPKEGTYIGHSHCEVAMRRARVRFTINGSTEEHNVEGDGEPEEESTAPLGLSARPEWHALSIEALFDPEFAGAAGIELNARVITNSGDVNAEDGNTTIWIGESDRLPLTERRFFKPSFIPPDPPLIFADESYGGADPMVPVDGQVIVWASTEATDGSDQSELGFSVDGVDAPYQLDTSVPAQDAQIVKIIDLGKGPVAYNFMRYLVTVPDGCGEGELRARRGIVRSEPISINVSNRGLIGYYYDFDQVLRDIPDMSALNPVMKRLDKSLRFENNTDFDLPMPAERFSAEWYGAIRIPEGMSGEWTFHIQSDDGFRLTIDDTVVSEFPGLRPPRESSGKIVLSEGWHDLHLTFYENDVLENMVIWWVPPDSPDGFREFIPLKHLSTERVRGVPEKTVVPPDVAQK